MAGKQAVAQELANLLIPAIRSQAGCQSATFFADSDSGDCGLLVLWQTKEQADAAAAVIGPRLYRRNIPWDFGSRSIGSFREAQHLFCQAQMPKS